MLTQVNMDIIYGIIITVIVIALIISAFGYQLVSSGKSLRKARRFASALIDYTPAYIVIIVDENNRIAAFKSREHIIAGYDSTLLIGRSLNELSFLPSLLRDAKSAQPGNGTPPISLKTTAPLQSKAGARLFIDWEMLPFFDHDGKIEFKIAYGFDRTELLETQQKLKILSAHIEEAQERERKKIAEDLHDRIGEMLIVSKRGVTSLKKQAGSDALRSGLDQLSHTIQEFINGARTLIFELIPTALYSVGLAAAVEAFAVKFKADHNIQIELQNDLGELEVDQKIAIFLFKVIRECAINANKHGGADQLRISLWHRDNEIEVTVEDNGQGFEPGEDHFSLKSDSGFGLFNFKNRAEQFGGYIEIANTTDLGGGMVCVRVPLQNREESK